MRPRLSKTATNTSASRFAIPTSKNALSFSAADGEHESAMLLNPFPRQLVNSRHGESFARRGQFGVVRADNPSDPAGIRILEQDVRDRIAATLASDLEPSGAAHPSAQAVKKSFSPGNGAKNKKPRCQRHFPKLLRTGLVPGRRARSRSDLAPRGGVSELIHVVGVWRLHRAMAFASPFPKASTQASPIAAICLGSAGFPAGSAADAQLRKPAAKTADRNASGNEVARATGAGCRSASLDQLDLTGRPSLVEPWFEGP
jgi:hypothetical protein